MARFSHLIKGGLVFDGTGSKPALLDIGISGDKIQAVENTFNASAKNIIDAKGKYVMPGAIDVTNHSDTHWKLFTAPKQESMVSQGITTIVGGLCGSSLAPLTTAFGIRSIQKWVDITSVNINWRSVGELLEEIERHEIGVNFGTYVGHGTLRRDMAGDDMRELTKEESDQMKLLLATSLDEGAFGISFGLGTSHGRSVPQEEIIGLAGVAGKRGKVASVHLRNEGRHLLSSVVEAVNIARSSGARVQISHIKAIGRKAWGDMQKALTIIDRARMGEGLQISVDYFPYLRTGSLLYNVLPEWILEGGKERIIKTLKDPMLKGNIIESIKGLTLHYEKITISEALKDASSVGKTIAELSEETGITPEEVMIELLVVNDLSVSIFGRTLSGKNVESIAQTTFSFFGSDGVGEELIDRQGALPHPRSFGAAPRFLVCGVKRGKFYSWEAAINRMTKVPAELLGIDGSRGTLQKGYFADIVVFDPATLEDTATYSNPHQAPLGIEHVFVNGELAYEKGTFKNLTSGQVLRRT